MRHARRHEGLAAAHRVARRDECEVERRRAVAVGARRHEVGEVLHLENVRAALAVLKGEARLRDAVAVDEGEAVPRVVQDAAAIRQQVAQPPCRAKVGDDGRTFARAAERAEHDVALVLQVELVDGDAAVHERRRLQQREHHRRRALWNAYSYARHGILNRCFRAAAAARLAIHRSA